ncbi:Hypothetical protein D9617_21g096790 [Elsinoe fawcettii]|nr:Hypothetical protein D9617_21g096790 [Elsinoe fawcettii]
MTLEAEVPDIQQHHLRSQSNGGQHEANGTQSAWYLPWMDYVSSDGDDSSAVRPTPYTDDTSARVRDSISQALDQHGAFDAGRRRLLDQRVRQLVNAASVSEALKGLFHRSLNVYIFIGDLLPQAVQTSDHLLLAAFLAGAAYTYPSDLYFLITTLYDAAEAFIFEEITCRIGSVDKRGNIESMSGNEQESFGLLMSGILMSYFQLSQYHDEVSLRMREVRFPKLLELARQMSIFDLPKPLSGVDGSPNDMLGSRNIRCRLAFSIFLMDSEFFIFWRGTSRLSLSDMRIELPSGPSRTVATTAVDSIKVIQCFSGRRMSVVLDELLSPTTTIETLSHKLNTSVIGLGLISMGM